MEEVVSPVSIQQKAKSVRVENLRLTYGFGSVLDGVSFCLPFGSICALLGNNGEGKTSLFKVLTGFIKPSKADVLEVCSYDVRKRQKPFLEDIFFIMDSLALPSMKIERYVKLYGGFYRRFDEKYFYKTLNDFSIDGTKSLSSLSFGQQKKFMLAFALATRARALFFDEVINGFDVESKMILRNVIKASKEEERTFIISSHQVKDIEPIIDEYLFLKSGKIILQASREEIESRFECSEALLGESNDALFTRDILGKRVALREKKKDSLIASNSFDMEFFYACLHEDAEKIRRVLNR